MHNQNEENRPEPTFEGAGLAYPLYDEENQQFAEHVASVPPFIAEIAIGPRVQSLAATEIEKFAILAAAGVNSIWGGARKPEKTENGESVCFFVSALSGNMLKHRQVTAEEIQERFQAALEPFVEYLNSLFGDEEVEIDE